MTLTMPVSSKDASSALSFARTPASTAEGPALKLCFHLVDMVSRILF